MKFHKKSSLVITTALGVLMLSSAANAAMIYDWDRKSYSGAQCQPAYGNQSDDFIIVQGKLRNQSAGNRWVSCAITFDAEDELNSTDGSTATEAGGLDVLLWIDYSATAAGPTYTTDCTLAGRYPGGVSLTETASVVSAKTTTQQQVSFYNALDTLAIGDQATVQVSCLLPSKTAITTIKVYEYGRTDETRYIP